METKNEDKLEYLIKELDRIIQLQQEVDNGLMNCISVYKIDSRYIGEIDKILIENKSNIEVISSLKRLYEELKYTNMECVYAPPQLTIR